MFLVRLQFGGDFFALWSPFEDAFGLTISEFYVEFERFMELPFDEQIAILPNP